MTAAAQNNLDKGESKPVIEGIADPSRLLGLEAMSCSWDPIDQCPSGSLISKSTVGRPICQRYKSRAGHRSSRGSTDEEGTTDSMSLVTQFNRNLSSC